MYPAYKAVAELQDEKKAIKSMHYALEAEKIHSTLYSVAKDAVKGDKDLYAAIQLLEWHQSESYLRGQDERFKRF